MKKLIPCEVCEGSGSFVCYLCSGTGYPGGPEGKRYCECCHGRGEVICTGCYGGGFVEEDEEDSGGGDLP